MTMVNHYGQWFDTDEPTTGVVSMHSVEWINEDLDSSIDLSYEEAQAQYEQEKIAEWQEKRGDIDDPYVAALTVLPSEEIIEEWREEFNNFYDSMGTSVYLIGGWIKDAEGKYIPDPNAEYSAIADCGTNNMQVVRSKYATRAALCSPCYPGQCDLDTDGQYLAYDLPLDLYGSYRQNPNTQLTVQEIREARLE